MEPNYLGDILKEAKQALRISGISSWSIDAEIIMGYITDLRKEQLITHDKQALSTKDIAGFKTAIGKRLNLMPVQYIINKAEFMGLDFYVDGHVLIPRPDTEILVEAVIEYIKESKAQRVLDICTGSGAIAIALAKYCPEIKEIVASDISKKALAVAYVNAVDNGVGDKIRFEESDFLENITGKFDVIVSNPPYIREADIDELEVNVKAYEPLIALAGGSDGLFFYKKLAEECEDYLNESGRIFLEIGYDQAEAVTGIFSKNGFKSFSLLKDLAGLDRTLIFGKNI